MEAEQTKLEMQTADEVKPEFEGITLLPTKAGRGFKVIHDGQWFYARKDDVLNVVNRKQTACTFSEIKEKDQ